MVVGNGGLKTAEEWKKRNGFPYQVVLDPELNLYRELGMKRTALIWQALNFCNFAEDFLAGKQMPIAIPGEGIHVMGGDYVTDSSGKVVFAHYMTEAIPRDRPSLDKILAVM